MKNVKNRVNLFSGEKAMKHKHLNTGATVTPKMIHVFKITILYSIFTIFLVGLNAAENLNVNRI